STILTVMASLISRWQTAVLMRLSTRSQSCWVLAQVAFIPQSTSQWDQVHDLLQSAILMAMASLIWRWHIPVTYQSFSTTHLFARQQHLLRHQRRHQLLLVASFS